MNKDNFTYFSRWPKERVLKNIDVCLNEHERLRRVPYRKDSEFRREKREFIQDTVNSIYYEMANRPYLFVELGIEDLSFIEAWAEKYVEHKIKSGEWGYRVDKNKAKWRVYNGTCGHLAVLKALNGNLEDLDLSIGEARDYHVPDLLEWLGHEVGVKAAAVINFDSDKYLNYKNKSNLPLVLDYKNRTPEKVKDWKKRNKEFEERDVVEAQVLVGTKEFKKPIFDEEKQRDVPKPYKMYCFIWGVVNPKAIINGASIAFTLDPNAADDRKPGGAKAGLYDLHKAEYFETKEELIKILKKPEYKAIPYNKIKDVVDPEKMWDYMTKQFE